MNYWKLFAFCIAISCLALMTWDQAMFAIGYEKVCHYTPYGEWVIELPMTMYALVYLFIFTWRTD